MTDIMNRTGRVPEAEMERLLMQNRLLLHSLGKRDDEIERLRADRDSWADQADARVKDCVKYISEIERLRKDFMDLLRVAANDATAFQAEIELLREQLQVCMRRWIPFAEVEFRKQVKEAARCTENGDPL
jgi:hypothetical protein